jgi:hypothetical protein
VTKVARFGHAFVERVPERLEEGVLYVSILYATAMHFCACGCRREVVEREDRAASSCSGVRGSDALMRDVPSIQDKVLAALTARLSDD